MDRINFRSRPGGRKTFSERMEEGGLYFYTVAGLAAAGLFGLLWLIMALGTMAGF
jgi:hypothetical protein